MTENILEKDLRQALAQLMHPEINYSLIGLGMVKDIAVVSNKVTLTLNIPFMGIPIKDELVGSITETITKLNPDAEVDVNLATMSQDEQVKFMSMAQKGWKF